MGAAGTTVAFDGARVCINGQPTYAGRPGVEGLLFNVRTVNATFDDTLGRVRWWDDDGSYPQNGHAGYGRWVSPHSAFANTERFIRGLPQYREHGILAVNLNVQGGHPLFEGTKGVPEAQGSAGRRPNGHRDFYHNSGFRADGSLDDDYARRLAAVIDACDGLGMTVVLQLFYFGQDTVFPGEAAVCRAVDHAVDFVCGRGWRNVVVEIANEAMAGHYHHTVLKPARVAELIERARAGARGRHGAELLVSTSEAALDSPRQWTEAEVDQVFGRCDCVILHGGDNVETGRVGDSSQAVAKIETIRSRPWYRARPRPIIFNESDGAAAFEAVVARGASFGLHSTYFQTMWPPRWGVWENPTSWFFGRVRELCG